MNSHVISIFLSEHAEPRLSDLRVVVTALPTQSGEAVTADPLSATAKNLVTRQWERNEWRWEISYSHPAPVGAILSEADLDRCYQLAAHGDDDLAEKAKNTTHVAHLERRTDLGWLPL